MPTNAYIMFSDIKGFSSELQTEQLEAFTEVFKDVTEIFKEYLDESSSFNTWGDAIVVVSPNPNIIRSIIKFRDYFKKQKFKDKSLSEERDLPNLKIRIACHFGEFMPFKNAFTGRSDFIGKDINLTARIEPITRPNEIFVTKEFRDSIEKSNFFESSNIRFDELGEIPLAKKFGSHEIFVLREKDEERHIIDKLETQKLIEALPDVEELTEEEEKELKSYKELIKDSFKLIIKNFDLKNKSSEFMAEIASFCKSKGLYDEAIEIIEDLENYSLKASEIDVFPYRSNLKIQKIKANSLTRVGRYEEASEIMYGLYKSGHNDSDTLSMLSAQYKRRAFYDKDGELKENFDGILLDMAYRLYLEAFRIDINSYYSAINGAYLAKIIGGSKEGIGNNLIDYILAEFKSEFGENWWVSATIAEAYMLKGDYLESIARFENAIKETNPPMFELQSTIEQIKIYKHFINKNSKKEVNKIIEFLETKITSTY